MSPAYQIGPFRLDPEAGILLHAGAPTPLGRRAVAVLGALVARPREYVQKAAIMDAAWPGVVVGEGNLAVQIAAIRRVLAREPGGESWVETLARRGYRFVGPVQELAGGGARGRAQEPRRSNLTEPLTSFVGRERELAEVRRLLSSTRLLTLVGAGGVGKTRLALRVAAGLGNAYRDGVWAVEFAALSDPALVPQTVATVFGLDEAPGRSLTQSLADQLASGQLLLVLDNAEHVRVASAALAEALLRACPQVTLLVTSRERLGMAGELTYRVPSLSMPDPQRDITAASLSRYESARLFIQRAQLQRPQFVATDENASALASICCRLDGIPLALELAAARVRSMSVEEVNRRLDERFRLLTGGSTTALPRQQTLRSLIDWSYDLLDDAERALLCRLSVFSGGWTAEAAERVCCGAGLDGPAVLDLLTSLADKSLVVAEERHGATRHRLLETVREYARDRLRERGGESPWRERHLDYFLALAEEAEPHLTGAAQQLWFDTLETEHDNLWAALAWSTSGGAGHGRALRLGAALWRFWYLRGHLGEGRSWLGLILAAAPAGEAAVARAKVLTGAAGLARRQGDFAAARLLHEEGLALQRALGDRRGIAASLNNLGIVAREQCDYPAAKALYGQALALRREIGDRWGIATSLNSLGLVAQHDRDYAAARALHEEALAIFRRLREQTGIASTLGNLGTVARQEGDQGAARALFGESLELFTALGDQWNIAWSLENLADVALATGDPERAARLWGAAARLRAEIGCPLPPSEQAGYDRQVAAGRAATGDDDAFDEAWRQGRVMTLAEAVAYALGPNDWAGARAAPTFGDAAQRRKPA